MTVVFFWAFQYYRYSNSGTLPKKSYVIIYWIITILVLILSAILSIFMIFFVEFNLNNDIYRMFRLMFRFCLTVIIVFGLIFFGTGLFARIRSMNLNVPDKKIYMKIALVTFICAVIYTFFIFSNVFFFLIDHLIVDANIRKIRSLSLAQLEIIGFLILTIVFRPNEFLEYFERFNCTRYLMNTISLDADIDYETEDTFGNSDAYGDLGNQEEI